MPTKSFQKYIEKRLTKREIAEIERQAKLELDKPPRTWGATGASPTAHGKSSNDAAMG